MELPIVTSYFPYHERLKDDILKSIDSINFDPIDDTTSGSKITKTDYFFENRNSLHYQEVLSNVLLSHIADSLNNDKMVLNDLWFQQYKTNDTHTWHTHDFCHFSSVYFLELPDVRFKTQVRKINSEELVEYTINEGDILTFPSFLYHRSPILESNERKTIIAFNTSFVT